MAIESNFRRLLDRISIAGAKDIGSNKPDQMTKNALQDYDAEGKKLDNDSKRQNIEARKRYANRIFFLVSCWLACMLVVILLSGFGGYAKWFNLADSVLIALITTTTISVLGLFTIVVNYLFKSK